MKEIKIFDLIGVSVEACCSRSQHERSDLFGGISHGSDLAPSGWSFDNCCSLRLDRDA